MDEVLEASEDLLFSELDATFDEAGAFELCGEAEAELWAEPVDSGVELAGCLDDVLECWAVDGAFDASVDLLCAELDATADEAELIELCGKGEDPEV